MAPGIAIVLAAVFCCATAFTIVCRAQQKHASLGPVVSAYLTGLDEELNELEYQLRRDEISRADYERSKRRLLILRRSVERYSAESHKDIVPEYQALAEDELKTVGLNREYKADELIAGAELEGRWKIIDVQSGSERRSVRFIVLERLQHVSALGHESKPVKRIDPRDVIETIVVPDAEIFPPPQQPSNNQTAKVEAPMEAQKPGLLAPRLLGISLPEYTGKARDRKIEGEVIVSALFQRDGKIKEAKVEKGLGFGLDERAIEAVKRMSFLPAQLEGREVAARARIIVGFSLEKVYVYVGIAELSEPVQGEK